MFPFLFIGRRGAIPRRTYGFGPEVRNFLSNEDTGRPACFRLAPGFFIILSGPPGSYGAFKARGEMYRGVKGPRPRSSFFQDMLRPKFNPRAVLDISHGEKVLVISDFHMGGGRGDDLSHNGALLTEMLEGYYLPRGWYIVLNGDIEELQRFSLASIRRSWASLYRVLDRFAAADRLYKIVGNHDEDLIFEKDYPYSLFPAVRIETDLIPIYVYHGHQSSRVYTNYNYLVRAALRYFFKPFGIRNISSARSPNRRFYVEKQAYDFSLENHCISIIGHTHRPLFESLGRFEYIKFEVERLCRDYPASTGETRKRIASEVGALRLEMGKLQRSERRVPHHSLYGEQFPVPCLFNSGSAIGRKGINAIELDNENIALIYWFAEGEGKKFINRGWYKVEKHKGTKYRRSVLNQDRLEYIKARIDLLGMHEPVKIEPEHPVFPGA